MVGTVSVRTTLVAVPLPVLAYARQYSRVSPGRPVPVVPAAVPAVMFWTVLVSVTTGTRTVTSSAVLLLPV